MPLLNQEAPSNSRVTCFLFLFLFDLCLDLVGFQGAVHRHALGRAPVHCLWDREYVCVKRVCYTRIYKYIYAYRFDQRYACGTQMPFDCERELEGHQKKG
jgi:hypothetical protein